jgi:hypothetical protein
MGGVFFRLMSARIPAQRERRAGAHRLHQPDSTKSVVIVAPIDEKRWEPRSLHALLRTLLAAHAQPWHQRWLCVHASSSQGSWSISCFATAITASATSAIETIVIALFALGDVLGVIVRGVIVLGTTVLGTFVALWLGASPPSRLAASRLRWRRRLSWRPRRGGFAAGGTAFGAVMLGGRVAGRPLCQPVA